MGNKQRLFEILGKVDNSFKLNEEYEQNNNYIDPIVSAKTNALQNRNIVDDAIEYVGGIERWNELSSQDKNEVITLVSKSPDTYTSVDESNWGKNKANPAYTHFAVLKSNGLIVTGWDYPDYDQAELRQFKNDYFFIDLKNMEIDPKLVNIVTKNYLIKKGIDPYDYKNWNHDNPQ